MEGTELLFEAWQRALDESEKMGIGISPEMLERIVEDLLSEEAGKVDQESGVAEPATCGNEAPPLCISSVTVIPDKDWTQGILDRENLQYRLDELADFRLEGSAPLQLLFLKLASAMNEYGFEHPGNTFYSEMLEVTEAPEMALHLS